MVKVAVLLIAFVIAVLIFFIAILGGLNFATKAREGTDESSLSAEMFDPDAPLDPTLMGNAVVMDFIITCYYPNSPDDPLGGNDTCADGTRYWRDPNVPPELNLFAKTPDGRVIQGVVATVQDQHNPVLPWSMKDQIKLIVPAYNSQAEIHDHFASCVTDPRRLDLAMSGKAQEGRFFADLKTACPQARPYRDPGGSSWNSGTLMPITVIYPDWGNSYTDDGHCFPFRRKCYHYSNDWGEARPGTTGHHQGTDIFAPRGEPVVACYSGLIQHSTTTWGSLNCRLVSNDGERTKYNYIHLDAYATPENVWVNAGQVIGYNGDTGDAKGTGCHVHFEVHPLGGPAVNPYPILKRWEAQSVQGDPVERATNFMQRYHFDPGLISLASFDVECANRYGMDWRMALVTAFVESSGGRTNFHTFNPFGLGQYTFSSYQEAIERYYQTIASYGFGQNAFAIFTKYRGDNPAYAPNCIGVLNSI